MENIEKKLNFTPMRLDWTRENVRQQVFFKGGHHVGHIKVNADGSFDKDGHAYKTIKYLLENHYCPDVKLVTWADIKESKFIELDNFGLNYQASSYLKRIPDYYTAGANMGYCNTKTDESETSSGHAGSTFYHGCKGHWLLHDIQKNGLNQPIQCGLQKLGDTGKYGTHVHPGSVRQGVFGATDNEEMEIIVWDAYNAFDWIKPMEIDEWISIFCRPQFNGEIPTEISVCYSYLNIELQCSGAHKELATQENIEYNWRNEVKSFSKKVSKLFNGKPLSVYIGYDSRHDGVEEVQIKSHIQAMTRNVKEEDTRFIPEFKLLDISKIPEYTREYANQSTEFTYSRFLIPYLENYEGFSMFIDNDFIWQKPFWEMFYFLHPDNAVACVQYDYELEKMSKTKMGGEENVMYPKKLWSSLMFFNNAHEDCKKLTPEVINTATGQYLHQFEWTDAIDRIPDKYILTEGMSDDEKRYHAVHYTRGGPWVKDMEVEEIKHLEVYNKHNK
jgi:hypothetical protein